MNQLVYRLSLGALLGSLLATAPALAQGVGIGTTTPNAVAALDIAATATGKGLLIPRLDSATRVAIPSPPTRLLVYQTAPRAGFYYYTGAAWVFIPDKARAGDNLGNHTTTQNLDMQGNALVGTGSNLGSTVGVGVRVDGGLNLGQNTSSNISLGYLSGAATTGSANSFLGVGSGQQNTTGSGNTFSGYRSGNNNESGSQIHLLALAVGSLIRLALLMSTLAREVGQTTHQVAIIRFKDTSAETAPVLAAVIRSSAGRATTTGGGNTFTGRESGVNNTVATNNAFYGFGAGDQNTTGTGNVMVGQSAGQSNATGSNNVALGTNAGPNVDGLTNTVALGYSVKPTQSNTVILGNNASVGIGTTTPSSTLHVNGSLAVGVARNVAGGPASNPVPLGSLGYYGLLPTNSNGSQDVYQLPAPGAVPGRIYHLRSPSTSNTAYLTTPSGTDIFDGGSNIPSSSSNPTQNASATRRVSASAAALGRFTVSNRQNPLPVTLVSFTAERLGADGLLRWAIASEADNAYFEAESSADGRIFQSLGRVAGAGTSSQAHNYRFTDAGLARYGAPLIYYRLRQVDLGGTSTYSPDRTVQVPIPTGWLAQAYPNPSTAPVPLNLLLHTERSGAVQLTLRDALGRLVAQQTAQVGVGTTTLPLATGTDLATGVYLLHVRQGEQQQVLKLVRQ